MHLTAKQFENIVAPLKEGDAAALTNKRRAIRVAHRCRTSIMPVAECNRPQSSLNVMVKDISPRGVCILYDKEIDRGTNFILRLTRSEGHPVSILCTVAYCRQINTSVYTIGAEFTCVIPDDGHPGVDSDTDAARIRERMMD
jgi:hypothetical protein